MGFNVKWRCTCFPSVCHVLPSPGKEHLALPGINECFNTVNIVIKRNWPLSHWSQSYICFVMIMPINMNIQCSFVFTHAVFDIKQPLVDLRMDLPGTFYLLFRFRFGFGMKLRFSARSPHKEADLKHSANPRPSFVQAAWWHLLSKDFNPSMHSSTQLCGLLYNGRVTDGIRKSQVIWIYVRSKLVLWKETV